MFSQTAEYALRAVAYLAEQGEPRTVAQIAAATKVPPSYLSKVMQSLAKSGLVVSQRGLHGGFHLERPTDQLCVFDIIQAVDPIQRIKTCPLDLPQHAKHLCNLHQRMDDTLAQVELVFRQTTFTEILETPIFGPDPAD
ncbi:Rrf2 family transcriptional regulator [Armatimonas sp.]|uniref:RrF2 family transcriptional regulator n=1 Tax=Armatimonas sp. TaxID=1872638 RepID=UPI00286D2095|nr:Rrf2 family transcriptional regulator [Armatimonas sp.]